MCRFETIFRRSIPQLFYVPEIFQEKSGNRRIVSSLSLSLSLFLFDSFRSSGEKKKRKIKMDSIAKGWRNEGTPLERLEKKYRLGNNETGIRIVFAKKKSLSSLSNEPISKPFSLSLFFDSKQWLFFLPPPLEEEQDISRTIYHRILSTPLRYRLIDPTNQGGKRNDSSVARANERPSVHET